MKEPAVGSYNIVPSFVYWKLQQTSKEHETIFAFPPFLELFCLYLYTVEMYAQGLLSING